MTQEIKPAHVTFEQAKWLKEKGFDEECKYYYDIEFKELTFHIGYVGDVYKNSELTDEISAPEQHQVVEWLRVNHGIWVSVGVGNLFHRDKFFILIKKYNIDRWELTPLENERHSPYDTPQEAYSAAFDYILNNLI
jgi:hypothetical protein